MLAEHSRSQQPVSVPFDYAQGTVTPHCRVNFRRRVIGSLLMNPIESVGGLQALFWAGNLVTILAMEAPSTQPDSLGLVD